MKNKWWPLLLVFMVMVSCTVYSVDGVNSTNSIGSTDGAQAPKTVCLTIFHSNDFHGHEPVNLSRQAFIVKQERAENPNVLFLNAGDVFTRGKYHYDFYGELEFAELNAMGLDALTLGNNEFKATGDADTAQGYLFSRIKQANFLVLCANVRQKKDGAYLPDVKPYIVKTIDGVRVGIFGVSANRIKDYSQAKGLVVEDQLEAAQKMFPNVKAESDLVIALTHIGFDEDKKLAEALPGLAVIVGGDSHTVLKKPFLKNGIPIVQAGGENNQYLGRLDLIFEYVDNSWKLTHYHGVLIRLNDSVPEDPEVKGILDSFVAKAQKKAA
ncbi:MAG TPA: metallophosphatase [Bacillota bacterium]|nr:metallophosphatase [Bacillota bacterium]